MQVQLHESEQIVARGVSVTRWLVRIEDAWVPASDFPGARVERLDAEPGVVWHREVQLELPRGTPLLRVSSAPRAVSRTPLDYLERGGGTPRRTSRTQYRVGPGGTLEEEMPHSDTPSRSSSARKKP